jgi:general nucleoside transport system permease protein
VTLRRIWGLSVVPLASILLALLLGAIIILISSVVTTGSLNLALPLIAYESLFEGATGISFMNVDQGAVSLAFAIDGERALRNLTSSIAATSPLILTGLAVGFGFKAGLFNIGVQGQLLMGVLGAVAVGVALHDQPTWIAAPLAFVAGTLAGASFGFIAGALKAFRGAHEVVVTIMLNYIALSILAAAVAGPLRVPRAAAPVTYDVEHAALPIILGKTGHIGIVIAMVMVVIVWWLLYRTTLGFEIRTAGVNPDAARYAGMRPRRLVILAMTMSAGLGGMAGANELLGVTHLTQTSFATTVGFDSIAVALLARSNPFAVIPAAILFGAMRAGAGQMQIEARTPRELVDVLQAVILITLVALPVLARMTRGRGRIIPVEAQTITSSYAKESVPS